MLLRLWSLGQQDSVLLQRSLSEADGMKAMLAERCTIEDVGGGGIVTALLIAVAVFPAVWLWHVSV